MGSLIPGYEYDIFISYRQKDNKHDGWVTKFVDNLKGELEATFKEDVSVYFDENPHDRLQETHNVDKSLEGKLKCLIFIPILSQTYCDPNSYAWQYEFLAFNKLANEDHYSRDIRLRSGNYASRILPIRIHELEQEDIKLFEKETGSVLRAMDFVFKTATGVSRPLKTNEDHPQDNLYKTFYSDQINKVGHAIKDILLAMKSELDSQEIIRNKVKGTFVRAGEEDKSKVMSGTAVFNQKSKKWMVVLLLVVFCIVGAFAVFKMIEGSKKSDDIVKLEKSIAVLPFRNLSNDTTQLYFSDGIVEAILSYLSKIGELKVISSTSTKRYKDTELSIKEIAKELGVASILEGSVQKSGNNVRITAQLIEAKTDVHLWSEIYDKNISDIFAIQSEVAQNVAKELKATLTSVEKEQINKYQTQNPEAYNLYLQGRFFLEKRGAGIKKSIVYFEKSVIIDPDYALAYAGLADAYFLLAWYSQMPKPEGYAKSKEYVNKALGIDKNLAEAHTVLGTILCWNEWKWEEARKELLLAAELKPNFVPSYSYYSELLEILRENTEARKQINIALELDPFFPMMHLLSGRYYFNEGKYNESLSEYKVLHELNPDVSHYWSFFNIYLRLGEDLKAVEALQKILLAGTLTAKDTILVKDIYNKSGKNGLWNWLIEVELKRSTPNHLLLVTGYVKVGNKEEAMNWLEKYFDNRPSALPRINNNPELEILRSEPRFQAMIKKLGLSDYQIPN